jgi:hypothetical protein
LSVIRLSIPEAVAVFLGESPEQIQQRALEIIVLELYRQHEISSGRAAELLGMELLPFIRWSGALGIPFIDMTPDEWQQELRTLEAMDRLDSRS